MTLERLKEELNTLDVMLKWEKDNLNWSLEALKTCSNDKKEEIEFQIKERKNKIEKLKVALITGQTKLENELILMKMGV